MSVVHRHHGAAIAVAGIVATAALALLPTAFAGASAPSLNTKLLTVSQLPMGWAVDNSANTGGPGSLGCITLSKFFTAKSNVRVERAFEENGDLPEMDEILVQTPNAKTLMTSVANDLRNCPRFSGSIGTDKVSGTVGALSFTKLGTQSLAYSAIIHLEGETVTDDFTVVRSGNYLMQLQLIDSIPNVTMLSQYAKLALKKLG